MLVNFRVAIYEIILVAGREGLILPPYKGSTLRGGFGRVFQRITCTSRQKDCRNCLLNQHCPYAYIFETSPPPGSEALRNYDNVPRPFVLEPPLEEKTFYRPGETLAFRLILIGKAVSYLPYFIVAFKELGEVGIGKGRKKYRLKEIVAVDPLKNRRASIYLDQDRLVRNIELPVRGSDIPGLAEFYGPPRDLHPSSPESFVPQPPGTEPGRLAIDFLTMTRLKYAEAYAGKIEFHVLIRNLLRRLSSLAYFHHGEELKLDFTGLIARAARVRLAEDHTRWVDWERFSARQDSRIKMGGVVGRAVYEGEVAEFIPLLRLGELVHVGKGAVFGMGKYRVELV
ncbi:hypothetical protein Desku_2979 [Desulfofundulus kuznetsovii DSM 6115]|uniref:CRISPR-associated protein Cas6 C-terminal domain-containing protein n=1 Tax=Desulfofundulus kuznetsovii (strain DSM 6115 / VKM B-1805 / 17) TaxID=760568 RepID=A0AAU8PYS5_DESK7|nr:hypothetical protein Desku_2979 [Desulfofundulus kuznetsovii DSM 6115]